jgi:hypothetical protein
MKDKLIQIIVAVFILFSCQKGIKPDVYAKYIETGNQIATSSQAVC